MIAIFIFYNIARGIQAHLAFSKDLKHCNVITTEGSDWIMLDFDRTGFITRRIKCNDGGRLIRNLHVLSEVSAVIAVEMFDRKKSAWKPYIIRSCNEICRYATGIDIGLTWNPMHLYSKLIKYNGRRNYEVLSAWRRHHGISGRRQ